MQIKKYAVEFTKINGSTTRKLYTTSKVAIKQYNKYVNNMRMWYNIRIVDLVKEAKEIEECVKEYFDNLQEEEDDDEDRRLVPEEYLQQYDECVKQRLLDLDGIQTLDIGTGLTLTTHAIGLTL